MATETSISNDSYTYGTDENDVYRLLSVNRNEIAIDWLGEVEKVTRNSGMGDLKRAHFNMLRGMNFRGTGNPVNSNADNTGISFYTRPRCNLSYDNLIGRKMSMLGTDNMWTLQRAIRCLLDHPGEVKRGVITPLVDPRLPFIPMLTNNQLSLNGWPDPVVQYWTSPAGIHKESIALIDDIYEVNEVFSLQANFGNPAGDPISLLFDVWATYASSIYRGIVMPYPEQIIENEVDYQTRIYQFVLDPGRRFIQKWAITGAAFPTTAALGAAMNYDSTRPYNAATQQLSIPFTCMGAEYSDPIILKEFNDLGASFYSPLGQIVDNPMNGASTGPAGLVQITINDSLDYNYMGLPRINTYTNELQWWVTNEEYRMFAAS